MATLDHPSTLSKAARTCPLPTAYPPGSLRFDLLVNLLSAWIVAGPFLGGWDHNTLHHKSEGIGSPPPPPLYNRPPAPGPLPPFISLRAGAQRHHLTPALP